MVFVIESVDDRVALTRGCCEPFGIEDRYTAARIGDKALALKIAGRNGYADAADAKHARKKCMRQLHLV